MSTTDPTDFNVVCFTKKNSVRVWISDVQNKAELFSLMSKNALTKFTVLSDFLMYNCFDRDDLLSLQNEFPDLNPTWEEFTGIDPMYLEREYVLTALEFGQYVLNEEQDFVDIEGFMTDAETLLKHDDFD